MPPEPPSGIEETELAELGKKLEELAHDRSPGAVRRVLERAFAALAPRHAVLTTGLGMEGCALLDLAAPLGLPLHVVFLDTGFHFAETLELYESLERRYPSLRFERVEPARTPGEQAEAEGPELWLRQPDRCCQLRKVEPLARRLRRADLWISAIGRSQSDTRAAQPVLAGRSRFDVPKLSPLAAWQRSDVWRYVQERDVPWNPLHGQGYPSISCHHCTLPVPGLEPGEYSRAGRWSATAKTECGLHAAPPAALASPTAAQTAVSPTVAVSATALSTVPVSTVTASAAPVSNLDASASQELAMTETPTKKNPLPAAERAKVESLYLRGELAEGLHQEGGFAKAELPVLKFHGIYQQEDRDRRKARRAAGAEKEHTFMVRVAIPGGVMTAEQYLALDGLADRHADGSLRLTTRQGVQFHGAAKGELKPVLRAVHEALMTTFAACGDVRRNVMACPAPLPGGARAELVRVAEAIARELEPRTRAYHEIWLDGEKLEQQAAVAASEPFYGQSYLPRKFKIGLASEEDNCVDAHTQDCALIAILDRDGDGDRIAGWHLLAGGGLGMTHNKPDTFARLASPIGTLGADQAVPAVRAVAAIFRDHGNREDRRHARLKYLIEDWGAERFRAELESRLGSAIGDPLPAPEPHQHDHLGRHPQQGGGVFYGLWIENGRLRGRQRLGVREIVERFRAGVRVTPGQSLLFTDLRAEQIAELEAIAEEHGLLTLDRLPQALRGSMACPALPTCGLALADAERQLPKTTRQLAERLEALGLDDVPLVVRMTGCPNGCARPYNADIAFVGRRPGVYHVFVGGGAAGDRLADLWRADVAEDELVSALEPLLERFAAERRAQETLGDFYRRLAGERSLPHKLTGREQPAFERWQQLFAQGVGR